jgi:hypothetical protein
LSYLYLDESNVEFSILSKNFFYSDPYLSEIDDTRGVAPINYGEVIYYIALNTKLLMLFLFLEPDTGRETERNFLR